MAENITQGRAFPPPAPDSSIAADWVSAAGTVVSALLTGGALLIAAFTYRQQVADKHASMVQEHRAQANAVSVTAAPDPQDDQTTQIRVRNDSSLAISGVILVLMNKQRKEIFNQPYYVVTPGQQVGFDRPTRIVGAAYAIFTDKKGTKWRGWFNGDLEERTPTAS